MYGHKHTTDEGLIIMCTSTKSVCACSPFLFRALSTLHLQLQTRHQNGDTHFLTLEEILDETKLLDISLKQKQWLMNDVRIIKY